MMSGGVVPAFNPSILEVEADESLFIGGQPSTHSEFRASQGYIVRPCLKKKKQQQQQQKDK